MDVSPIQRTGDHGERGDPTGCAGTWSCAVAAATAQAAPPAADQTSDTTEVEHAPRQLSVVVAWHAASLGYVTRVVDQLSGRWSCQSPPEQVLDMVRR